MTGCYWSEIDIDKGLLSKQKQLGIVRLREFILGARKLKITLESPRLLRGTYFLPGINTENVRGLGKKYLYIFPIQ